MDFIDQLKQFSKRVESMKDSIQTEEATKTAIIMPFFSMLGYDVFNPQEFVPEFTADVGIKKGEKVDYAIIRDGQPVILIECKSISENLDRHDSQLFRYFGTTTAKFAILTNGIIYRFYTDLDSPNKMDDDPFLTINILDVRENQVPELKKFSKSVFDIDSIFSTAMNLSASLRNNWIPLRMTLFAFSSKAATLAQKHKMLLKNSVLSFGKPSMTSSVR